MNDVDKKSPLIWISLLLVVQVFLFSSFYLYTQMAEKLYVSPGSILLLYLTAGMAAGIVFLLVGWFLPARIRSVWGSLALGLCLYAGVRLLIPFPAGGTAPWFSADMVVWVVMLALCTVFSKWIYRFSTVIALLMTVVVFLSGVFIFIQKKDTLKPGKKMVLLDPLPPVMSEFSREKNVILVILDGFQSDLFDEVLRENPEFYRSRLEGFTFFRETTGSFPTTKMSIPAMVSGINYQNNVQSVKFIRRALNHPKTIRNVLRNNGYEVDLMVPVVYRGPNGTFSHYFGVSNNYGLTKNDYRNHDALKMGDRLILNLIPRAIGERIFRHPDGWLYGMCFRKHLKRGNFQGATWLLDDLIENAVARRETPVYKMIHLMKPHPPYIVDKKCNILMKPVPSTGENRRIQCRCSLDHFVSFLDRLKDLGIYDSSLIILQADHGLGKPVKWEKPAEQVPGYAITNSDAYMRYVAGSALPLTLIKPPYSRGELRISDAQTSMTDLPATVYDLLKIDVSSPGISMFKLDPEAVRERKFYRYLWRAEGWFREYFGHLDEFVINGSVFDPGAWRLNRTIFSPSDKLYRTGKIDLGTKEAFYHRQFGWANTVTNKKMGFTYNRTFGSSASVFLTMPKDREIQLTARLKARKVKGNQYIVVYVDDRLAGSWHLADPETVKEYSVILPPDPDRPHVSVVAFVMSEDPEGNRKSPFTVLFDYIKIEKKSL